MNIFIRRLFRLLAIGSLLVGGITLAMAAVTWQKPVVLQFTTASGTTYFFVSGGGCVRLVRQGVSPSRSGTLRAITSALNVMNAREPNRGAYPGFMMGGGPVPLGFQLENLRFGWSCPPGTLGGLGLPGPTSVFVFSYWRIGFPYWSVLVLAAGVVVSYSVLLRRFPAMKPGGFEESRSRVVVSRGIEGKT